MPWRRRGSNDGLSSSSARSSAVTPDGGVASAGAPTLTAHSVARAAGTASRANLVTAVMSGSVRFGEPGRRRGGIARGTALACIDGPAVRLIPRRNGQVDGPGVLEELVASGTGSS
ncbi:hypothetical protein BTZ20_1264 [Rhodococcus sp. MTM3W5.2]|nr:hypothetical protein BTZ20_1264 [Rhodococcus sp. MTM3W5.2]